jgi:NADPH:quinone reductase-like Zn-dependent oxidoreductase
MSTQKAVVCFGPGDAQVVADRPVPALRDGFILVKTVAVALNPTDWKHVHAGVKDTIVGCDYAGIVEAVGEGVTKEFNKGDKVYGAVHGSNRYRPDSGAFAQYTLAKGDLQSKIPDNLTFEEAATLGIGLFTVGQGMYQNLGLALPTDPIKDKTPVLIYGGSTATGSLGIQFAKLYVEMPWHRGDRSGFATDVAFQIGV